jgi:hypothetical protein
VGVDDGGCGGLGAVRGDGRARGRAGGGDDVAGVGGEVVARWIPSASPARVRRRRREGVVGPETGAAGRLRPEGAEVDVLLAELVGERAMLQGRGSVTDVADVVDLLLVLEVDKEVEERLAGGAGGLVGVVGAGAAGDAVAAAAEELVPRVVAAGGVGAGVVPDEGGAAAVEVGGGHDDAGADEAVDVGDGRGRALPLGRPTTRTVYH